MSIFLLIVSFVVILSGCELFVNGIEWFGRKLNLGEGAVGSVLSAVGTALPETIIPIIAIVFGSKEAGKDIGIGAILGAPFMLSTLSMFVIGVSVLCFRMTKRRTIAINVNKVILKRNLLYFFPAYTIAILVGIFDIGPFRYAVAGLLIVGYALYVRQTMKCEGDLEGDCKSLYFHRTATSPDLWRVILQIIVALMCIIFGADLFVGELTNIAKSIGIPALVISMLLTPVATELPEKFNGVLWMRAKKDTLALGDITGAMVFQSTFPVAIGMCFTDWKLLGGDNSWHAAVAAGVAVFSGILLYSQLKFFKKGFGVWSLLFGGVLYGSFVSVLLWDILK